MIMNERRVSHLTKRQTKAVSTQFTVTYTISVNSSSSFLITLTTFIAAVFQFSNLPISIGFVATVGSVTRVDQINTT